MKKKQKITAIILSLLAVLIIKLYSVPNSSANIAQAEADVEIVVQEETHAMLEFSEENGKTLILATLGAGCLLGTAILIGRRSN